MKKNTRIMAAMMAALLTAAMPMTAAAETINGSDGGTTFGIIQTTTTPANVSYELPLYVTMAVVSNQGEAVMPTSGYKIKNLAAAGGYGIKVTNMTVEKLAGSTFDLVASGNLVAATDIYLKVGGAELPVLNTAAQPTDVTLTGSDLETATIAPQAEFPSPLEGKVLSTVRTAADAAAQFKIVYTVSAVDTDGTVLGGGTYVGDSKTSAGLN